MKKKIISLLLICALALAGCGNSSDTQTDYEQTEIVVDTEIIENAETEEANNITKEDINAVDKFVEMFNEISEAQITNLTDIDIHDKSGGYYRTEYRTHAYDDAISKHGVIDENASLDLIQYSHGFRVYVIADSYESFQEVLETTIKIYDSSVTEDTIQTDVYDKIDSVGSGVSFYINDITGYYEVSNRETGRCSVMLDTSPIGFF